MEKSMDKIVAQEDSFIRDLRFTAVLQIHGIMVISALS